MALRRFLAQTSVEDIINTPASPYGRFSLEMWDNILQKSLPSYPFDKAGEPTAGKALVAVILCQVNHYMYSLAKKYLYRRCTPRMLLNRHSVFGDDPINWPSELERGLRNAEFIARMEEVWNKAFVEWESRATVIGPFVEVAHWDWSSLSPEGSRFGGNCVTLYRGWEFKDRWRRKRSKKLVEFTDALNDAVCAAQRRLINGFSKFVNLKLLSVVHPFCGLWDLVLPSLTQLVIIGTPGVADSPPHWISMGANPTLRFLARHPLIRLLRLDHQMAEGVGEFGDEAYLPILPALEVLIVAGHHSDSEQHAYCLGNDTCGIEDLEWVSPIAPLRKGPGILERRVRPHYHLFSASGSGKKVEEWCEWGGIGDPQVYVGARYGSGPPQGDAALSKPLHPWDYGPSE